MYLYMNVLLEVHPFDCLFSPIWTTVKKRFKSGSKVTPVYHVFGVNVQILCCLELDVIILV